MFFETLGEGLLDIPYFCIFILAHIFIWRIPQLWCIFENPTATERRRFVAHVFNEGLYDLPYVMAFLLTLPFLWRTIQTISGITSKSSLTLNFLRVVKKVFDND